jgi:hypothetical protein
MTKLLSEQAARVIEAIGDPLGHQEARSHLLRS